MTTFFGRAAAAGLIALLSIGTGAWALPGDGNSPEKQEGDERKVLKRKIVIVGPDGKEKVIEGPGLMVRRGFLGVGLTEMTPELRSHFGAPEKAGVLVSSVEPDSPAGKAGVRVGDVIARVDGKDVTSSWDVRSQVRELDEGEQVPLEIWRDRKVQTLTATISLRERPELDMGPLFLKHRDGEDGPTLLRWSGELEGMPGHIELPALGEGEPGYGMRMIRRERSPRELELEKKLQELEKRIAEMEKLLTKKGS